MVAAAAGGLHANNTSGQFVWFATITGRWTSRHEFQADAAAASYVGSSEMVYGHLWPKWPPPLPPPMTFRVFRSVVVRTREKK